MADNILNLMVIDEEQLYAEKLVALLSHYYDEVNLGFWDDKKTFIKALRSEWDVLVFSRAYDMSLTDVVGLLQEHRVGLPIIQLTQEGDTALVNEDNLPQTLDGDMVKSLVVGQDALIVTAICLLASYSQCRRQVARLNGILTEAEQRANILISNSKSAVAYIDEGVHIFANEPYLELFGYDSMEEIIGVPVVDLIAGGDNTKAFKRFLRRFDKGDRSQVEFEFESRHTDGTTFASSLQLASATFEGEPVVQMIIQRNDVNASKIAKQLAAVTRQDALTGLSNRTGFMEQLQQVYDEVSTGATRAALVYVAINDIGKISSSAGLAGVDTTIKYMANLLTEVFESGVVSRFSDATFAVLLTDTNQEQVSALAEQARERAESSLIEVGTRTVKTTLSIGVVMMDTNAPSAQTVLERAIDTVVAITSDTDGAGNQVRVFDISTKAGDDDEVLAEYIQTALTQNRFKLSYQPIYDINTDSSELFEVYLTLPMADGSELTFDKLIGVAKKHHLLDKIDRWLLINASKQLAMTRKSHPNARLLIALSAATLADKNLPKTVAQLIKAIGGGDKQPLTLQFHEQDLVDYLAAAKRQFMSLKDSGCPVGIQNFGLTAKSEEVLEYLSPTLARLARSYTKNLDRQENMDTVKALVDTAREQGCDVLMPYIEDAQMMSMSWSVGARFLQGFYLQAPAETLVYAQAEGGEA